MKHVTTNAGGSVEEPISEKWEPGGVRSDETKKACVMRVDMPKCPESALTYWVEGSNIHFFADEPAMPEYENSGRKYGCSMVINPEFYNIKEAKAKLINGLLWITVIRYNLSIITLGLCRHVSWGFS